MALKTVNGFVLMKDLVKQDQYSDGGIYVGAAEERESPAQATVVCAPEDSETGVQSGDTVLVMPKAVQTLKLDGSVYYLIGEKSLIGIISNGD